MNFVLLGVGLIVEAIGIVLKFRKPHFQKEKTTSGRIIRYLDYQESRKYRRKKIAGIVLIFAGIVFIGTGLYVTFLAEK